MSEIKKKFYNLFWQELACQNLFLLSKEELLETKGFDTDEFSFKYSSPRIIISNIQNIDNDAVETIRYRNENSDIFLNGSINKKLEEFKPLFEEFFDKRFRKSFDKLILDIEKKGWSLLFKIIKIVSDEENREKNSVKFLQQYGFVGKNLNTFQEIEDSFKKHLMPSKGNELINENTINTFFEGIKFAKEMYVNQSYKRLYNTNQILINTLNSEDDFNSRTKLFHKLYEAGIIFSSNEDAFIECTNCEPGMYKGVFKLKINPKKLTDLKCPICSKELTYFVPYELHNDIYEVVKSQDGLLLDALCNLLESHNLQYSINKKFANNIEVDCYFTRQNITYIVETKMYKINTTREKLKSKLKEHFFKLTSDVMRLRETNDFKGINTKPVLLVNIVDANFLKEVENEIKASNTENIVKATQIININSFKFIK